MGNVQASSTVAMNYANYEDTIIQGHNVMIVGWPEKVPFTSPSTIGNLAEMCILNDAWMSGTACWIRMSNEQIKTHAKDLEDR